METSSNVYPRVLTMTDPDVQRLLTELSDIKEFLSEVEKKEGDSQVLPRLLAPKEVAQLFGISIRTLSYYRDRKLLPYVKIGGSILYPVNALRKYIELCTVSQIQEDDSQNTNEKQEESC